jgi:hypothetical protein
MRDYDYDNDNDGSGDFGLICFLIIMFTIPAIPTWRMLHGSIGDLIIVGPFVYLFYSIITVLVYGIIVKPMIDAFKGV